MKKQRKIKFRIWDTNIQEYLECFGDMFYHLPYGDEEICGEANLESLSYLASKDNMILQQFTGLYDINDKEIYEGDIIKITDLNGETKIHEVFYSERWAQFEARFTGNGLSYYLIKYDKFEVIGNVFENSNLI